MLRALVLYFLVLLLLVISQVTPQMFGWLPPYVLAALFFGTLFMWREAGFSLGSLGFTGTVGRGRALVRGLALGMVASVLVIGILSAGGWANYTPVQWPLPTLLPILIAAAAQSGLAVFSEETIFRGFYLQWFALKHGPLVGVLVSAILWSVLHWPALLFAGLTPPRIAAGAVAYLLIGLALGLAFTGNGRSLWLTMAIHFGYTFTLAVIAIITTSQVAAPQWLAGDSSALPASVAGMALGCILLVLVAMTTRNRGAWREPLPKPIADDA